MNQSQSDILLGWRSLLAARDELEDRYTNSSDEIATYLNEMVLDKGEISKNASLLSEMLIDLSDRSINDESLNSEVVLDLLLESFTFLRPPLAQDVPMTSILVGLQEVHPGAISWVYVEKDVHPLTVILDSCRWVPNYMAALVLNTVASIFLRTNKDQLYDRVFNPQEPDTDATNLFSDDVLENIMEVAASKANDGVWNWCRIYYNRPTPPGPHLIERPVNTPIPPLPVAYIVGDIESAVISLTQRFNTPPENETRQGAILAADAGIQMADKRREVYGIDDTRYNSHYNTPEEYEAECFRYYGPSNPFFLTDEDDIEDVEPGSDRMFLCTVHNYNHEDEEDIPIYDGKCDWKGCGIAFERAAVRCPVPGGGWRGSYCTFTHTIESVEDARMNVGDVTTDATLTAIDVVMQQTKQYGIYKAIPTE